MSPTGHRSANGQDEAEAEENGRDADPPDDSAGRHFGTGIRSRGPSLAQASSGAEELASKIIPSRLVSQVCKRGLPWPYLSDLQHLLLGRTILAVTSAIASQPAAHPAEASTVDSDCTSRGRTPEVG